MPRECERQQTAGERRAARHSQHHEAAPQRDHPKERVEPNPRRPQVARERAPFGGLSSPVQLCGSR